MIPSAIEEEHQDDDEAARALLALLFLPVGRRQSRRAGRPWCARVAAAIIVVAAGGAGGHDDVRLGSPASTGRPVGEAEEVRPQLLGRGVARGRILGHRLHDHGLERGGDGGVGDAGQHGLVAHVLRSDGDRGVAGEGRAADRHLVEDDAERVDVAAGVDALALGLLG